MSFVKDVRIRVAVILINDDKILLIQHKKHGKKYWVVPGGGLNFGESLEVCAKREIKEETNLDVSINKLVFTVESISKDLSRHILNLFFTGKILGGKLKLGKDNRLNDLKFIKIDRLDKIKLYPTVGKYIKKAYYGGFKNYIKHLSPEWI